MESKGIASTQSTSSSLENGDLLTSCMKAARISMLSVGSGDFSQQKAIVEAGHTNLVVTSYDSESQVLRKYPHAKQTLEYLKKQCKSPPLFEIDGTKLHTYNNLFSGQGQQRNCFDLIFFTFPHTGIPNNNVQANIISNRKLLKEFLQSAQHLLKEGGEIQITLKRGDHYDKWNVPTLLEGNGLQHVSTHCLDKSLFPGYVHRLTNGMNGTLKRVIDKKGATVHVFGHRRIDPENNNDNQKGSDQIDSNKNHFVVKKSTKCSQNGNSLFLQLGKVTIVNCFSSSGSQVGLEWTDEEIWAQVVEIMTIMPTTKAMIGNGNSSGSNINSWKQNNKLSNRINTQDLMTVLDIRRQFPQPVPDTRSMNRVLYQMEKQGFLKRHNPCSGSTSQKPTWSLGG